MILNSLDAKTVMIIRSTREFPLWADHSSLLYAVMNIALQKQTLKHRKYLERVNP